MTVAELEHRMSERELQEWQVADKLDFEDDEKRRAAERR